VDKVGQNRRLLRCDIDTRWNVGGDNDEALKAIEAGQDMKDELNENY
jgi:hypothetical protein